MTITVADNEGEAAGAATADPVQKKTRGRRTGERLPSIGNTPQTRLDKHAAAAARPIIREAHRTILLALHDVRFLTSGQVSQLLHTSRRTACKYLTYLYRHRFIDRQVWGFTRNAVNYLYCLDVIGTRYVGDVFGRELAPPQNRTVSHFFVDHCLAVTDLYIAVTQAVKHAGLQMTWHNESAAADHYEMGPDQQKLEPDAVVAISGPGCPGVLVFIEADCAAESTHRWGKKVLDYNAYTNRLLRHRIFLRHTNDCLANPIPAS